MKYIILLLFITLVFADENNLLLNIQYINKDSNIKELFKSTANSELGVDLFNSISSGDILVKDEGTNQGKFVFVLDDIWDRIVYSKRNSDWIDSYGEFGEDEGQFNNPQDIHVLKSGKIYIADTYNERIVELLYDFSNNTISFVKNINLSGWYPRKIFVNEAAVGGPLMYITTISNKLLLRYTDVGPLYKYPEDFPEAPQITNGAYSVFYNNGWLFVNDKNDHYIHSFCMNDDITSDVSILFSQSTISFDIGEENIGVKDFVIHGSFPDDIAYFLDNSSKIKMRILSYEDGEKSFIPGVDNKPDAAFNNLKAIGIDDAYGDVFIAEQWDTENGIYWYALGPEIQQLVHEEGDYENINNFEYYLPDKSIVKSEIIRPNGDVLVECRNEQLNSSKVIDTFNEYQNNSFIPYGEYSYRITAESAYDHIGESDNNNPIAIINKIFTGGVLPSEGDIVSTSNYFKEGCSYTLKNNSNSGNFSPEPPYDDTWRVINSGNDASITDLSETGHPYLAKYRASNYPSGNLAKVSEQYAITDEIGFKASYSGQTSTEATRVFTVNQNNPNACPVLYINDKPYVNLLPQSPHVDGLIEDRITIPAEVLDEDTLHLSIRESGTDISVFKSIDLFLEDVEKGTNLIRLSSGMSLEYKTKIYPKISSLQKTTSQDFLAGDTLFFSVDQSGDAVLSTSGYYIGPEPINYCAYEEGMSLESVYQVTPPTEDDLFIDAAYLRTLSYENNFLLKDTLSNSSGQRDYYIIFHIDMRLESFDIYYLEDNNPNKVAKANNTDLKYFYPSNYKKIENNISLKKKKIPTLKPDERIDLSFILPKIKEYYQRYGYLRIVGRYDPSKISNLLDSGKLPKFYEVYQNFPNPFNPSTNIPFSLVESGHVKITIYNLLGQKIKTIEKSYGAGGFYSVNWDGKNEFNFKVSSGLYIYKVDISDANSKQILTKVKKMLFLK